MIASLKRRGLYEVSIGLGKDSYENDNDWLNDGDRDFGAICLALSPSVHYLIGSAKYPKDIWTKLDRPFGKHNEDHNRTLEITSRTTRIIYWPLISLMKFFNMKMKQNLLHSQFELKKVSLQ